MRDVIQVSSMEQKLQSTKFRKYEVRLRTREGRKKAEENISASAQLARELSSALESFESEAQKCLLEQHAQISSWKLREDILMNVLSSMRKSTATETLHLTIVALRKENENLRQHVDRSETFETLSGHINRTRVALQMAMLNLKKYGSEKTAPSPELLEGKVEKLQRECDFLREKLERQKSRQDGEAETIPAHYLREIAILRSRLGVHLERERELPTIYARSSAVRRRNTLRLFELSHVSRPNVQRCRESLKARGRAWNRNRRVIWMSGTHGGGRLRPWRGASRRMRRV